MNQNNDATKRSANVLLVWILILIAVANVLPWLYLVFNQMIDFDKPWVDQSSEVREASLIINLFTILDLEFLIKKSVILLAICFIPAINFLFLLAYKKPKIVIFLTQCFIYLFKAWFLSFSGVTLLNGGMDLYLFMTGIIPILLYCTAMNLGFRRFSKLVPSNNYNQLKRNAIMLVFLNYFTCSIMFFWPIIFLAHHEEDTSSHSMQGG